MSAVHSLFLGLGLLWPAGIDQFFESTAADPARLREMLHDRQHPRNQNQAALLLVLNRTPEAEEVVRDELRQTDAPEIFLALTAALRLSREARFNEELLAALDSTRPPIRQAAADTLTILADAAVVQHLRSLLEDVRTDPAARQLAVWILGRSGLKSAAGVLVDQLAGDNEALRRAAGDSLAELTGQSYGTDVNRWRAWWTSHKDMPNDRWLEERLAYQMIRGQRLEGELERTRAQVVRLHQQIYSRLTTADRFGHVQGLVDNEDPAVRALAVGWSAELLSGADTVGQRALAELLLRGSRDGNAEVQRVAVLALGRVNDPRAFAQARALLRRGPAPVRAAAAHALAQLALNQSRAAPLATPPEASLVRQVIPLLQKALDDPALEVVVAAAEDLGALGVPEAGPVLAAFLRHASDSVRQTVALALERVADAKILDALLRALEDRAVTVRFSLVGAIGHAAGDGQGLPEADRARVLSRLEELMLRDPDAGVRSRSATVLGQCAPPAELAFLYRRAMSHEDNRVQEKAWTAFIEIIARSANPDLLREWERTLTDTKQGSRRLQLLGQVCERWKKGETPAAGPALEMLVQAQLDEGKWAAAFAPLRELLARPGADADVERRLRWLVRVGDLALQEGNRAEALRAAQDAQPFLARQSGLAAEFEQLEKRARN
jgi:HEAT repeat protein